MNGSKRSPGGSVKSSFLPSLAKLDIGKEVGRRKARLQNDRAK